MFVELELGLKSVTTYEVKEEFFDDFREPSTANNGIQPPRKNRAAADDGC